MDKTGEDGKVETPTIESLTEQVKNLNEGIGKYRSEAQKAQETATQAETRAKKAEEDASNLKKQIEDKGKDDKAPKLSDTDQKRLEQWAKEQGFVSKADLEVQRASMFQDSIKAAENQAIEEFQNRHPEYKDEKLWDKVKLEFSDYRQPADIAGYRKILNKIHKDLSGDEDRAAEIRARDEQRRLLGLGGGNSKGDNSEEAMTLEKLQDRYPNLSTDQIASRLTEINELAKERLERNKARKK